MSYCANCSQELTVEVARAAMDFEYCWRCGGALDDAKCRAPSCSGFNKKPGSPPKKPTGTTYCHDCGMPLGGVLAKLASSIAEFCCECGTKLSSKGTCRNVTCVFNGAVPKCVHQ